MLTASFIIIALSMVWYNEGLNQPSDRTMFVRGAIWLMGSSGVVALAFWLRSLTLVGEAKDRSFKLVESKSRRSEKLVQDFDGVGFFVFLALHLWAFASGSPLIRILTVVSWLGVALVAAYLRILIHELGHLIAAWLLHSDLRKMQVGIGPVLWSRSFENGLKCEWRARPLGGYMLATHRGSDGFRFRQSIFVLGGPIADLILLLGSYQLILRAFGGLEAAFVGSASGLVAVALFWWTASSAVGGLVPFKFWMEDRRVWTDGYWLFLLWTSARDQIAKLAVSCDWRRGLEMLKHDLPKEKRVGAVEVARSEVTAQGSENMMTFEQLQARLASRRALRQDQGTKVPESQ